MINLLKSELFRIGKSKGFWILTVLLIVIGQISPGMSGSVNDTELAVGSATTGAMGFLDSLGASGFYLIILTGFIASYICAGFEQRTLQDSIAAGFGRGKIVECKSLGVYVVAFVMLLAYSLSYTVAILYTKNGGMGIESGILLRMILSLIAVFIQNAAQATLVILIAFVLKKVGLVMAIGIAFYSIGTLLLSLAMYRYEWLAKILEFTPFIGSYSVTSGFAVPLGNYFSLMALNLGWTVGLLAITYASFRKSELR